MVVSWEISDIELCENARDGEVEKVLKLIEIENRNPNVITNIGAPLTLACQHNHMEVVQYLLTRNKIDLLLQDNNYNGGDTAFHIVSRNGNVEILKLLLNKLKEQFHEDQNRLFSLQNESDGRTALMLACQWGHYEIVETLFQLINENDSQTIVPDLEIRDKYGKTAEDIASERHYEDIIKLLVFEKSWNSHSSNSRRGSHASFVTASSKDTSRIESEMFEELECPICWEYMDKKRIFTCTNSHLFCEFCQKDSNLKSCPKCREDFLYYPPKRSGLAERWARILFKQN